MPAGTHCSFIRDWQRTHILAVSACGNSDQKCITSCTSSKAYPPPLKTQPGLTPSLGKTLWGALRESLLRRIDAPHHCELCRDGFCCCHNDGISAGVREGNIYYARRTYMPYLPTLMSYLLNSDGSGGSGGSGNSRQWRQRRQWRQWRQRRRRSLLAFACSCILIRSNISSIIRCRLIAFVVVAVACICMFLHLGFSIQ